MKLKTGNQSRWSVDFLRVRMTLTMDQEKFDIEYLIYIVRGLVNYPDDVKVERSVDEMGVLLSLSVNPEDMGLIIGKAGHTARTVRGLMRIFGLRHREKINLKIEEPEGGSRIPENL